MAKNPASHPRTTISFYGRCATRAWAGSWARANNFAATVGGFLLLALAWGLGLTMDAPASVEGAILFTLLATGASILLVWTVIFLVRFVLIPAKLHREAIDHLTLISEELAVFKAASPLEILYDLDDAENRFVMRGHSINHIGQEFLDPDATSYVVGVRNNRPDKTINKMHFVIEGDDIIRRFPLSRGFQPRDLHPTVTDLFLLLLIRQTNFQESKEHDPYDALNKIGYFTIRVHGQDTKEAVAKFKYDPAATHHIVMLRPS
jgi:hypothetical protein